VTRPRPTPAAQDAARSRPRLSLTLSPEARALAEALAERRHASSLSALVELLVREEAARRRVTA